MENKMMVDVKLLHEDAVMPEYAHVGDSGFDLVAIRNVLWTPAESHYSLPQSELPARVTMHYCERPGYVACVPTGLAFGLPEGYELQVRPRSGLAKKFNVAAVFGTADTGYRGELWVILWTLGSPTGDMANGIVKGMKVAQAVLAPVTRAIFKIVDTLPETDRGANGFNSSGTSTCRHRHD